MIVATLSDIHGNFPIVPKCDLLILAGDICRAKRFDHPDEEKRWLDEDLRSWLNRVPARKIIAIAGNHDYCFAHHKDLVRGLPWTILEDETADFEGLEVFGAPWKLWLQDHSHTMLGMKNTEPALERRLSAAKKPDVLVFHNAPKGILDEVGDNLHIGSKSIRSLVRQKNPALVVFGHVHEAHGRTKIDGIHFANSGIVKPNYQLIPEIFVYEMERNPKWHVVSVETKKLQFEYKHDPNKGHIRSANRG